MTNTVVVCMVCGVTVVGMMMCLLIVCVDSITSVVLNFTLINVSCVQMIYTLVEILAYFVPFHIYFKAIHDFHCAMGTGLSSITKTY